MPCGIKKWTSIRKNKESCDGDLLAFPSHLPVALQPPFWTLVKVLQPPFWILLKFSPTPFLDTP